MQKKFIQPGLEIDFNNSFNDFQNDESGASTIYFALFKQQLITF